MKPRLFGSFEKYTRRDFTTNQRLTFLPSRKLIPIEEMNAYF